MPNHPKSLIQAGDVLRLTEFRYQGNVDVKALAVLSLKDGYIFQYQGAKIQNDRDQKTRYLKTRQRRYNGGTMVALPQQLYLPLGPAWSPSNRK